LEESLEKHYSLYGFIITEGQNERWWMQHVGDVEDTGEMMYITGKAYIQSVYDVLLLGRWKSLHVDKKRKTFDEVEAYLSSLKKWDKTKYYVKLADLGLYSLLECKTGEVVFSEHNEDIMKSLRFYGIGE
jgi:hypothetical protein